MSILRCVVPPALAILAVLIPAHGTVQASELIASGRLSLSPKLNDKAKGIRTLYLVIYDENSPRPMPFGARKITLKKDASGQFMDFKLTRNNVQIMGGGAKLPTKIRLKARLDQDGSAGMDQAGDLVGQVKGLKLGQKDVKLLIDSAK